ncbi:hypothetical protein GJAV_G00233210 [Gymnothorax javanicus]|nr:hypothetical protein GJAV_G00233210 [Gymnothorax javanicus]
MRWMGMRAEATMTANKSAAAASCTGGSKAHRDIPERCQSASPPPAPAAGRRLVLPLSDGEECVGQSGFGRGEKARLLSLRDSGNQSRTLQSASQQSGTVLRSHFETQNRLIKARSISCLDHKLSVYSPSAGTAGRFRVFQEQKENQQDGCTSGGGLSASRAGGSTLSLGPSPCTRSPAPRPSTIRCKISEWECRRVAPPRMSLCLEKRPPGDRAGGSERCASLLSSPCSDKTFDCTVVRRASVPFSDRSHPEAEDGDGSSRPEQDHPSRPRKAEPAGRYTRSLSSGRQPSAVLSRIQKIEEVLKESPAAVPQYPSSCYARPQDRVPRRGSDVGRLRVWDSPSVSKRSSVCSGTSGSECPPGSATPSTTRQRGGASSTETPPSPETAEGSDAPVNPVPKPKRTFEYDANRDHDGTVHSNGLPPGGSSESPPPLPSGPPPPLSRALEGGSFARDRDSGESEDASSLCSSLLGSHMENGSVATETRSRPGSKSTLEDNPYEDILESQKENPYEDVELKGRMGSRKARQLSESSQEEPSRMWLPQDRMLGAPPPLTSKSSSQSLRLPGPADRNCHRGARLVKRHSHDDGLLLPSSRGLLGDGFSPTALAGCPYRRVPKLVQRINSIYCAKRGKKRLKKLSMSNIDTVSLRDDNSESESDSDDRFKAHTQRLLKLQTLLHRSPSYRTLELQLLEWQERELFQYFVVVSLRKKPNKSSYAPEVTYQFPKLERPTKQMREAEQRLKAIPQFCFPDARDWSPVSEYSSETFSFMLTGEDGSRRFGYCRRLLPSGKGPRLPEVYCVISRLGCFHLFSKILDEVERRRGISAALVYPFMRSLMESPFPAPGKTIKVKTFLPGAGNEVMELRRPADSRLEHVDMESLFNCLSVRQVVRVFASLLLERRVIFVADKLSTLSSCMHAVVALLYPFSWQHTFIPVLPASMLDIVCCPTPFVVGLLSSSLPKLKELPVEEALMVDLGTDRFIRQMDDEATLLPRKLQAALEQALEQRNDIINQDSDSESDEECNSLDSVVSEAFIRFFLETIGHYSLFLTQNEQGGRVFQRLAFRKSVASKSIRRFLGVFMETQMFAGFIQDRELRKCRAKGLFEQRVEQYLEELPDTEQSGVNKFLKGLGSKIKFLHKKS